MCFAAIIRKFYGTNLTVRADYELEIQQFTVYSNASEFVKSPPNQEAALARPLLKDVEKTFLYFNVFLIRNTIFKSNF